MQLNVRYGCMVAFLLCMITNSSRAETVPVLRGEVILEDGHSAAAEISRYWVLGTPDHNGARAYGSVQTDSAGNFSFPLDLKDLPADLVVYTSDRTASAVVHVTELATRLKVVLRPTTEVRFSANAASVGSSLEGTRFLLNSLDGKTLGQLFGNNIHFPFPQGSYQLSLSSSDTVTIDRHITVPPKGPAVFRVELSLSAMARSYGRQPPTLSGLVDDMNHPFVVKSFDRPTLLYFWADWCQPCIAEGIPHLLEFANKHKGQSFQIIAIHENGIPSPSTVADFQRSLKHLATSTWKQQLSFPFVFDMDGKVTSKWGLSTFPTYALVDGRGKLQRGASLEKLNDLISKQN